MSDAARIGVLGGTFDPVHIGHLFAAVEVRHALALDQMLLMVAGAPWQKQGPVPITPAEDRYAMVAAAVQDVEGLEASRMELDRGGVTYTADTLHELGSRSPGAQLYWVVGSDVAAEMHTWQRVDEVRKLATLVVVERAGAPRATLRGWTVERVEIPRLDVSSSDLRQRLRDGRPVEGLVPPAALHWIRQRGLYAGRDSQVR